MTSTKILRLRLDDELCSGLDKLAKSLNRSRTFVAAEAIRHYVDLNNSQIGEIQKGIAEANHREFASIRRVARLRKKWTRPAR